MPRVCPAAHGTNPHWQWVSGVQARLPKVWGELEQWGDYNLKKVTFWHLTFCTILFSSNFTMTNLCRYISKGIWIAMNVSLETSFRMSVRPVEKVFCFCLYSFSCFVLFMLLFFDKKHTRLVQSHKLHTSRGEQGMQGVFSILSFLSHLWFQPCPICHTSDFNQSYLSHFWFDCP